MHAWCLTDPGIVRLENQDYPLIRKLEDAVILAVVCDGMGGANAGNVASRIAAETFCEYVVKNYKKRLSAEKTQDLLLQAKTAANLAVYECAESEPAYAGMGTTLVAALVSEKKAMILNVGDSRAYHVNVEGIRLVTVDHSFVQMMIARGELTPEQAKNHPNKHIITRAIGTENDVQADIYQLNRTKNDTILLCSDGLSNTVAEQEILFEVLHGENLADCGRRLIDIAKTRGAPDNVTVAIVGE